METKMRKMPWYMKTNDKGKTIEFHWLWVLWVACIYCIKVMYWSIKGLAKRE